MSHEYMWCEEIDSGYDTSGSKNVCVSEDGDIYVENCDDGVEFDDEDDAFINSKDPLLRHRRSLLYDIRPGQTIAVMCAMLDDEKAQREASLDKSKQIPNILDNSDLEDEDIAIEYISLQEHMSSETHAAAPGIVKCPLKPFEQWVDDVLSGKKSYDDPL